MLNIDLTTNCLESSPYHPQSPTGSLPAGKPVLARGQVYCGNDFRLRATAWFTAQKQSQKQNQNQDQKQAHELAAEPPKKAKKSRWASTPTPTRIQPARAAKSKKRKANDDDGGDDDSAQIVVKHKKAKTAAATVVAAVKEEAKTDSDYSLSPSYAGAAVHDFQAVIDTVLESKRAALTSGCYWSTVLYPPRPPPPPPSSSSSSSSQQSTASTSTSATSATYNAGRLWCPIVAAPLACTDMAYCLHGVGLRTPSATAPVATTAPVAYMTLPQTPFLLLKLLTPPLRTPLTPPPAPVLRIRAKLFAETRHIKERTVQIAGLRFAVDMCNGALRVCMV